ncbi:NADH dehydrogenase [ubiquinone] 1 beta subcomplex subunit 7, partial [Cucurbita argyrosperma subsp. argyrosperma]
MEVSGSSKKMIATQAEMVEARVPIPYRDQCAHLLIPLNVANQSSTSHGNAKTSAIPSRIRKRIPPSDGSKNAWYIKYERYNFSKFKFEKKLRES